MMQARLYDPVPGSAVLSLGGFTYLKPAEWEAYLNGVIQSDYPAYYQKLLAGGGQSALWRDNACILEALEKYLWRQFGVVVPPDNLFKVYNQEGEGVSPEQILAAVCAVIEPLGFEIELVMAADAELRGALDHERVVGLERADAFEGRAGVCMIHIQNGFSHAFFWEKMDAQKFSKPQFRLAVLVRPKDPDRHPALSAMEGVEAFCRFALESIECAGPADGGYAVEPRRRALAELERLRRYLHNRRCAQGRHFRRNVERRLAAIVAALRDGAGQEAALLVEAGEMMRRVVEEAKTIQ